MIVFFDSNIYIGERYRFNTSKMETVKKLLKNNKINLIYTKANKIEISKHMHKDITAAIQKYNNIITNQLAALSTQGICKLDELEKENLLLMLDEKIEDFFKLYGVKEISLTSIDIDKIMEDYASQNLPFESSKPNEFKDAIMINALKNYQEKLKEKIFIVSKDEGFFKTLQGNDNFKVFDGLDKFLEYCNEEEEITNCIEEGLKKSDFSNILTDYFINLDLYVEDLFFYIILILENNEVIYRVIDIERKDEDNENVYAVLSCEIELEVEIDYRNEDMSYYDKEEGKYLFEKFDKYFEKHKIDIDLNIQCNIEKNQDELELKEIEIIKDEYIPRIVLNDTTIIGMEQLLNNEDCEI